MISLSKTFAIALTAAGVAVGSFAVPAMAQEQRLFDATRLDQAQAGYTQYYRGYRGGYRGGYYRGWRGPSRGAAIAGAVGLGILGAAAVAANNRAYAAPYYDEYYAPPPPPVYAYPQRYYAPYGGYYAPYDFRDHR